MQERQRSAKEIVIRNIVCLVAVIFTSRLLWSSGRSLGTTSGRFLDWPRILAANTAVQVDVALSGVAWLIILLLSIRVFLDCAVVLLRVARQLASRLRERKPQTIFGVIVSFMVGPQVSSPHPVEAAGANNEYLMPRDEVRRDNIAPETDMSKHHARGVLPALASAGLALGITKHIQRERAVLLKDAPSSAQLDRPDSKSLATGIGLFERSAAITPTSGELIPPTPSAVVLPIGIADDKLVSLTLRPGDIVRIEAEKVECLTVLRHLLNTAMLAPWLQEPKVVVCGFGYGDFVCEPSVIVTESPSDAMHKALQARRRYPASPVIVVSTTYSSEFDDLPNQGVMVISTGCAPAHTPTRVIREHDHWRISSTNERFLAYGVSVSEAQTLRHAAASMTKLDSSPVRFSSVVPGISTTHSLVEPSRDSLLVRVLGPVQVTASGWRDVAFRKSKSLELLCWLAFHRDRPTVSGARTALWEIDVKDATFHNVLSELRHGLSAAGLVDGAGRVGKHQLFLDERIITDAETLRDYLLSAETSFGDGAMQKLREMLSMVSGLPFSSVGYTWADAEGITSTLVWRVTRSVELVARFAAQHGDRTMLLDAVAAGLRMSPGDEQFLELQDLT
ncbi:MAG: hypothetical protein RL072_1768 [Actinomycetota bacterium]|jgi:hypothetical protein